MDKHSDEQLDEQATVTRYDPPVLAEMGTFGHDTLGNLGVKPESIQGKRRS